MIKEKINKGVIEVDLTGTQGNAFYLMGLASQLSKKMGLNEDEIIAEMTSGNYENLIKVFDKHFGNLVILYR